MAKFWGGALAGALAVRGDLGAGRGRHDPLGRRGRARTHPSVQMIERIAADGEERSPAGAS